MSDFMDARDSQYEGEGIPVYIPTAHPDQAPIPDEVLLAFGCGHLIGSARNLVVISDDAALSEDSSERIKRADTYINTLKPGTTQKNIVISRFMHVKEMFEDVDNETDAKGISSSLLVELCRSAPADVVLGVGELGQSFVTDLRRNARKFYPHQASKFITQAEAEHTAAKRPYANEQDAFMLVALERLYDVDLAEFIDHK